jgi:hypothetical protein
MTNECVCRPVAGNDPGATVVDPAIVETGVFEPDDDPGAVVVVVVDVVVGATGYVGTPKIDCTSTPESTDIITM